MNATLAAAALVVGYLAGRTRPASRSLDCVTNWAWRQVHIASSTGRRGPSWWAAQALVFAPVAAAMFVIRPRRSLHIWRHRHDPAPRSEPIRIPDDESAAR